MSAKLPMLPRTNNSGSQIAEGEKLYRFYSPVEFSQSSISRSFTPEGFLVCHDVPIARIGVHAYGAGETKVPHGRDGIAWVTRDADQLFSPETLASFEGKPITIDHPPEEVGPDNVHEYEVGHVQNVRRGSGPLDEFMLADFMVKRRTAIDAITKGLVQVSNGYDAEYQTLEPGRGRQHKIIGNHVALVEKGRCGPRCAIGDKAMSVGTVGEKKGTLRSFPQAGMCKETREKIRSAFHTRDSDALEAAMAPGEIPAGAADDGSDKSRPIININIPGTPKANGAVDPDSEVPMAMDGELKKTLDSLNSKIDGVIADVAAIKKTRDSEAKTETDEEKADREKREKEKKDEEDGENQTTKDSQTRDSAGLRDEFQTTIADAEILAPGIGLPTFDSARPHKLTTDGLCNLRRKAMTTLYGEPNGPEIFAPYGIKGAHSFKTLDCSAAKAVFVGAVMAVKAKNNSSTSKSGARTKDGQTSPISIAEINKRNREQVYQKNLTGGGKL